MAWTPVLSQRLLQYNTPLTLSYLFRSSNLIISAALDENAPMPFGKRTYKYAGRLTPIFTPSGVSLSRGNSRSIYLGSPRLITFNNPYRYDFNLEVYVHYWTPQLDLIIWQSDEDSIFDVETELGLQNINLERIENKIDQITESINANSGQ